MDDEEEVLLSLAEVLGNFLEFVGGPANAIHIMKPLEKLCQVEESTVREKVSQTARNIYTVHIINLIELFRLQRG